MATKKRTPQATVRKSDIEIANIEAVEQVEAAETKKSKTGSKLPKVGSTVRVKCDHFIGGTGVPSRFKNSGAIVLRVCPRNGESKYPAGDEEDNAFIVFADSNGNEIGVVYNWQTEPVDD